jgi:hypothetical protein
MRVAFPRIQSFDSSATPRRGERFEVAGLPTIDLPALADALAGYEADDGGEDFFMRHQMLLLEQRLQRREQELAMALDRITRLEAALHAG